MFGGGGAVEMVMRRLNNLSKVAFNYLPKRDRI